MAKFIVEGDRPLRGEVEVGGNKNAALPIICATILTDKKITLRNVPKISDVKVLLRIMKSMGTKIKYEDKGSTLIIDNSNFSPIQLDKNLVGKFRGSILLIGPMLARFKKVETWMPGGCKIGQRPLDSTVSGFQQLGAKVSIEEWISIDGTSMKGSYIWLEDASVTGTEALIMAAVTAKGKTTIYDAASEPHVQDLCNMLNSMGADIKGIGSNLLEISGVEKLDTTDWTIIGDHMEIVNFISAAMMTDGSITVKNALKQHMFKILKDFEKLGVSFSWKGEDLVIGDNQKLVMKRNLFGRNEEIYCYVWPQFPADVLQYMVVNATKPQGTIIIHDKMYENRLFFFDQLNQMGANIVMCDPHRLLITGPTKLKGTNLVALDIRGGAALVIAALGARGTSVIDHVELIDRGYEDFEIKLNALGANIQRTK